MADKPKKKSSGPLSEREQTVINLAAHGMIDKEIAAELGLSLATVRTYWDRIRLKLQVSNRAHAVRVGLDEQTQERVAREMAAFVVQRVSDIAIFACAEDGTLLTWNPGVETLFGYEEAEWVGQHCSMFFMPEEKDYAMAELYDADRDGASVNDRWHVRRDGSKFWGTNTVINFNPKIGEAAYSKIVRAKPNPTTLG